MLNLICGRSGSGKTEYIINSIKESISEGKRTYLLVPEQQGYITDCMFADLDPSSALLFEVVSFSRIAELVFGKYGGLIHQDVNRGMRNLIMWENLRELTGLLSRFSKLKSDRYFSEMMLSVIDELSANSIKPQALEDFANNCEVASLSEKMKDISLIYANFENNLSTRLGEGVARSEDKYKRLEETLSKHSFFENSEVFVDSFTSFTGVELSVLAEIMNQAANTHVSLCCDPGDRATFTLNIRETAKQLKKTARMNNIDIHITSLTGAKRMQNSELRMLEKCLWDFSIGKDSLPNIDENERGNIELIECTNEYDEAECAALKILDAHRSGVDYSNIAVIIRNADTRKGIINTVFDRYKIPYFLSEKTDLSSTSASRFVLSALRAVHSNFRLKDILTLIKTGLCPVSLSDADLFEEYCRTWNIHGKTFSEPIWSMNPDGYTTTKSKRAQAILDAANRVRATVIPPLEKLSMKISASGKKADKMCFALYEYLCETNLSNSISSLAEYELSCGNVREAGELIRLYDSIISSIGIIATVLSDAEMTAYELSTALEILLAGTELASIPSVGDYVTIGSAATLRVENVHTAILLGLCEGEFPANFSNSGLISESEKETMSQYGICLQSREENVIANELYYVYHAMTKPSSKLILSTCNSSASGGKKTPSSAFNRIKYLFPYIKTESFSFKRILEYSGVTKTEPSKNVEYSGGLVKYDIERIDPVYIRKLFGDRLRLTKSKIDSFIGCPYKYFSEYVLNLRQKKNCEINSNDAGTFIHYILEKFLSSNLNPDGSLKNLCESDVVSCCNQVANEYLTQINGIITSADMYTLTRLRNIGLIMLNNILKEFNASPFRIVAFEQSISDSGPFKPMDITVFEDTINSPKVILGGVVDRIDKLETQNEIFVRIIDYKTSEYSFDINKIQEGKDIQLPAYLFTTASDYNKTVFSPDNSKAVIAASAQYLYMNENGNNISIGRSGFILDNPELLSAASANLGDNFMKNIKKNKDGVFGGKALVDAAQLSQTENVMKTAVSQVAKDLYSGIIYKKPESKVCEFCNIRNSCHRAMKN